MKNRKPDKTGEEGSKISKNFTLSQLIIIIQLSGLKNYWVFLQTLVISCKKSSTNASGIKYQLQTTNRSSVIARTTTGNLQWTSGFVSATEVKFEAKNNNHDVEFKSQSPQLIDLFLAVATLGTITLDPGTYTEVEFEVELNPVAVMPL